MLTPDEKQMVAYHEAGHAVVAKAVSMATGVQKLSIVARGRTLGHTTTYQMQDRVVLTQSDLRRQLKAFLRTVIGDRGEAADAGFDRARWDALVMYDKSHTNGTEQRAFAGNFLFSTGVNPQAGRTTRGHFDLPLRHCTIRLDGCAVVENGRVRARGQGRVVRRGTAWLRCGPVQ